MDCGTAGSCVFEVRKGGVEKQVTFLVVLSADSEAAAKRSPEDQCQPFQGVINKQVSQLCLVAG